MTDKPLDCVGVATGHHLGKHDFQDAPVITRMEGMDSDALTVAYMLGVERGKELGRKVVVPMGEELLEAAIDAGLDVFSGVGNAMRIASPGHHINCGTMGRKSSDFETIPLCASHHQYSGYGHVAVHDGLESFEARYGTERELLAQTLSELGITVEG